MAQKGRGGYTLDLTGAGRVRVGDEEVELDVLGPRRREARAIEQLVELSKGDGGGFVDALYEVAALVLSNNAQGVELTADELAESLSVGDCKGVVAATQQALAEVTQRLGKA